jgi:hypothetical protein
MLTYGVVMPEITVSDSLYRQLIDASAGEELDQTMWRMVHKYQRGNSPGE